MKGQEILAYFKKKLYLCRLKRLEPLKTAPSGALRTLELRTF